MFSDPIKNLKQFDLREDMIVADLGAGTGFYSLALSKIVPRGKVYAIEVVPDYLQTILNKVKEAKIGNVDCFLGDVEKIGGTKLKDGIIDRVVASNILFQVEDKDKFIEEVKRILKKDGQVLLIDWTVDNSSPLGNRKEAISKEQATLLFTKKGFSKERDIDAGEHHYGMIFIINK
ncbi:MAG: class I SAM-dependent methyltransferase [Candidatus Pacebacteria bacterium]|nr:class I SAM-dependent methyltransferase [Candidatus Paceibacterota bacterium]